MAWSHTILDDPDGTCRLEITDEDGELWPTARQLSRQQASALLQRISAEAASSGRPIKTVIRDPYFMAATVIMVKRLPD